MNEQGSFEQGLQALRLAAERGDWNAWADSTEALLLHLPAVQAVRLTRDFVTSRLPVFERHQPGVHWPRELLEVVSGRGPANGGREWSFGEEFSGPGGNSFAKAVESLWIANQRRGDARRYAEELRNALGETIMAEMVEHWGSRHPKEWALWYQLVWSEEDDRTKNQIQLTMMTDPEVRRLERAGWLEVGDRLEAELRKGAG